MVGPYSALNIHLPHNVLGKLDSAEGGFSSCCEYRVCKALLIKVSATFLFRGVAALAQNSAEGGAIQQQPAFYVWVRDSRD